MVRTIKGSPLLNYQGDPLNLIYIIYVFTEML